MGAKHAFLRRSARTVALEHLEQRLYLAGDGVDDPAPCLMEVSAEGETARAAHAVNCFAVDLYQHLQREQGNLLFSPLSISTALTMFYAGAAEETAAQMEHVLHLGTEPGIHESFATLLEFFDQTQGVDLGYTLELANAMWPQTGITLRDEFVETIRADYGGEATSLDYQNTQQSIETINEWVAQKTHDQIQDLVTRLDPNTLMAVTNSIYFKSFWASYFDPERTSDGRFRRDDGTVVTTPMMNMVADFAVADLDGNRVLEMPFREENASMVFIVPRSSTADHDLTPEELARIDSWLDSPRDLRGMRVRVPKFTTTVATQLEDLLAEMMPRAFINADFSNMTTAPMAINQVRHKAFFEVKEEGAEAAAATIVAGGDCFGAGTPILTRDGVKPIERLSPGDYVVARNEFDVNGKVEPKLIKKTFCYDGETLNLHARDKVIRVTKRHPFFVKSRGWTSARDLRAGDLLASDLRGWIAVDQVEESGQIEPVYNFSVADHRTYFLGGDTWGFSVWVHNCSAGQCFFADRPFHFLIRDNTSSTLLFMGRVNDPTQTDNDVAPIFIKQLPGDSNNDGIFDSADLVRVFNAGKYEDGIPGNATYEEGDWNLDGDFDSSDLVLAFRTGNYRPAARSLTVEIAAAVEAVFAESDRERVKAFVP